MIPLLLLAQLSITEPRVVVTADGKGTIVAHGPKLTPAEAAAVLMNGAPERDIRRAYVPPRRAEEELPWPVRPSPYRRTFRAVGAEPVGAQVLRHVLDSAAVSDGAGRD
jgi:hypothetical protein